MRHGLPSVQMHSYCIIHQGAFTQIVAKDIIEFTLSLFDLF